MEILKLGSDAIIGVSPSGSDVRTSDIYEHLTQEVDKRNNLSASGAIDWQRVVDLSAEILANHSKDLLVGSYLTIGLLHAKGVNGLVAGVQIFRDLIINFWDNGLFPTRPNGRLNAIAWWVENTTITIHSLAANDGCSSDEHAQLAQHFDDIINFLDEHSIETGISELYQLKNICAQQIKVATDIANSSPVSENNSDNTAQIKAVITPASTTNPSHSVPIINDFTADNVDQLLENTLTNLTKVSGMLANEQPFSYKIFMINRIVAWLDINVLPMCDNELKTMLPPPDESLYGAIKMNYQSQNWSEVIRLAESRVIDLRFWLDLSYYVYHALKAMNHEVAAREVSSAVLAFTKRLAGVEKLLFSDGTPFANQDTQGWLSSLDTSANNYSSSSTSNDDNSVDSLSQELAHANELLANNQLAAAINYLHETVQQSNNQHLRLRRAMQFCHFCVAAGCVKLTASYIDDILIMVHNHQLEKWAPELAADVFALVLDLGYYRGLNMDSNILSSSLASLALIAPARALAYYK